MQFSTEDEDGDFLAPEASRSRLSSLFHSENRTEDVNQALTFTAPKQPKKNESAQDTLKLIHAAAVTAYKLVDGNYSNQGKLGCAILGHHETHSYKLLLYKGKQVQVTVATVTPNFVFHVQSHNYANFYDEKKENWSINFDSELALFDFVKQVALARANSQGHGPFTLIIQDLLLGEGPSLENGDAIEIKYTGWLLSNSAFGSVFDSNMNTESSFRLRLGKSKVIKGWSEGLLGIKKNGKRLLIVPPDLAYGSEGMSNVVPPNSILIFEVHVVKVKTVRDSSHSPSPVKAPSSAPEKKPDVPLRPSISQDDNIKQRGASISEQLSQSPKKDKAQLISRMAKMGTATLPFQGAIAAHVSSDSDSEVEPSQPLSQNASRTASPKLAVKPRSRANSGKSLSGSVSVMSTQPVSTAQGAVPFQFPSQVPVYDATVMPTQSPSVCNVTPFPGYPPQLPPQYSMLQSSFSMQNVPTMVPTNIMDSHMPMLINETRNQNIEVRLSLSKITDQVHTILTKVDDMHQKGRSSTTNMPFMEGGVLLQNIERIIQENTRLTKDLETKNSKIEALNEKICDLFHRNQRFFEESSNMLEKKNDSLESVSTQSQEKILRLEQEKARLQLELSSTTIKLKSLEDDISKFQEKFKEVQRQLDDTETESEIQKNLLKEKDKSIHDLQTEVLHLKSAVENVRNIEEEKNMLLAKVEGLEQAQNNNQETDELIKLYKKENEQYKGISDQLKAVIHDKSKLLQENENIRKELEESLKLNKELETKYLEIIKKHELFQEKSRVLKERYEQIVKELKAVKSVGTSSDFSAEIKKVMNVLYKLMQGKFESDISYDGSKVLEIVLQTIMGLTLQILERKSKSSNAQSSPLESSKNENAIKQAAVASVAPSQQNSADTVTTENDQKDSAPVSEKLSEGTSNDVSEAENVEQESSEVEVQDSKDINCSNDSVSSKENEDIGCPKEGEIKSNTSEKENTSESIVHNNTEDTLQLDNVSAVKCTPESKSESPENNLPSSVFSEQISGNQGTKV